MIIIDANNLSAEEEKKKIRTTKKRRQAKCRNVTRWIKRTVTWVAAIQCKIPAMCIIIHDDVYQRAYKTLHYFITLCYAVAYVEQSVKSHCIEHNFQKINPSVHEMLHQSIQLGNLLL